MTKPIHVLNGPNLNLLGVREPEIYGRETLADIEAACAKVAGKRGLSVVFHQSNHEGGLVELVHGAREAACGIIINPAAYTHTSVALHDALKASDLPVIELHLSNPHAREAFRHKSYVSPVASAIICGLGAQGYSLAIEAMAGLIATKD